MKLLVATLAVACAVFSGCKREAEMPAAEQPQPMYSYPKSAQPKLQTMKLFVGAAEINAELALRPAEWQTGMMFRQEMGENEGMLFAFPSPHQASFWMLNTFIPLSAAYIDPKGVILEIHDLEPHNTNSVVSATTNVQYVLETRQGWFKRNGVTDGMVVRTEHGSLPQMFKPGQGNVR